MRIPVQEPPSTFATDYLDALEVRDFLYGVSEPMRRPRVAPAHVRV
jgi:hypothetical protein